MVELRDEMCNLHNKATLTIYSIFLVSPSLQYRVKDNRTTTNNMDRRSTMALEIDLDEVNGAGSRTLESMRTKRRWLPCREISLMEEIQPVNHAVENSTVVVNSGPNRLDDRWSIPDRPIGPGEALKWPSKVIRNKANSSVAAGCCPALLLWCNRPLSGRATQEEDQHPNHWSKWNVLNTGLILQTWYKANEA